MAGPRVGPQAGDGGQHQIVKPLPLDHRHDPFGLSDPAVGDAERRGLDQDRPEAHQAPQQRLVDPHHLDLGARNLDASTGGEPFFGDQQVVVAAELQAVVPQQGLACREDPGCGKGGQEGAEQRAGLELAQRLLGRLGVELAEQLQADGS
jgi:hypothetical protein